MKLKYTTLPLLILVIYFYLTLFSNALIDDAFITLSYVRTLLNTGTWGFYPGDVVNAVTSPLNIFVLSLVGIFLGPTVNAVLWVSAVTLALTVLLLGQISLQLFQTKVFGYVAAAALLFNPLIISTLGLESILFAALYVLCAYLYLEKRWSFLAIGLGLITLTRFDGILFFLVALLFLPNIRVAMKFSIIYMISIAPWYVFSWIYFGSLLPDTLFIKIAQHAWEDWDFLNGMGRYFAGYRSETIFSLLFLPLLLLMLYKQIRNLALNQFLLLTSSAHFIGYSLLHVPPYHWYYVPEITAIIVFGSLSLGQLYYQNRSHQWKGIGFQGIAASLVIVQLAGMIYFVSENNFAIKEMPIHSNWGSHEQYKEIGTWLKENTDQSVILVDGEIGTLGYYCDCQLSSFFSDRKWLRHYARKQLSGTDVRAMLYRVNFLFLEVDKASREPGYLLQEIPGGKANDETSSMDWNISTHWTPHTLVRLVRYSP